MASREIGTGGSAIADLVRSADLSTWQCQAFALVCGSVFQAERVGQDSGSESTPDWSAPLRVDRFKQLF